MNLKSEQTNRFSRWRRRVLAVLLVPVGTLLLYAGYTVYHANFRSVVAGEVYRSGQMDAGQLARAIERFQLKSVLNLRGENPTAGWYQAEIETTKKLDVVHYDRSLSSKRELTLKQMDDFVALLRQAPKPMLIHCEGGADRSGLASALYELAIKNQTPEKAGREFSIWYGHVPFIRPHVLAMDRSYWCYVSNRTAHQEPKHQPAPISP